MLHPSSFPPNRKVNVHVCRISPQMSRLQTTVCYETRKFVDHSESVMCRSFVLREGNPKMRGRRGAGSAMWRDGNSRDEGGMTDTRRKVTKTMLHCPGGRVGKTVTVEDGKGHPASCFLLLRFLLLSPAWICWNSGLLRFISYRSPLTTV